jgi:tetratricopeptide (TPR) repeat protein/energy-coupling factor transporter ATP-binding protein EcfA2
MASTASSYDLFLSYSPADHRIVDEVAHRLADAGLKELFLDRWNLPMGTPWRPMLEKGLGSSKAVAIFVGPGEMATWQQRELDIALDLQSKSANFPVIPVLLPGCDPPLGLLGQFTWVDLRSQGLDIGSAILAKAARGEELGSDLQGRSDSVRTSICPYRGLLPFREEDAPFFFGREAAIDKLLATVQRYPFVAVVGASGCGKSSTVRAGLVPRLRSDRHTAWETVILVPTAEPLKALSKALAPLLEPTMGEVDRLAEASQLAEHLSSGTISLSDIVEHILEKQCGTDRVLIIVDQFEELYTLTSDEEVRRCFLGELLAASSRAGSKANIILTLRGDFVGKALANRPLSDQLQDAQVNLGPMTPKELECAIRKPAEKIQLEFEPGLVRRILNDAADEPGNLPLLEFVLSELWDKQRGSILLNESYDAIGRVHGAIGTKADELYRGLSLAEQKTLQRVFLRIVRPSETGPDTRRRATLPELPSQGAELVCKLVNERLLVTNRSASDQEQTVEVAHEALISNWSTLRAWLNNDREFLLWRERFSGSSVEWERAQESDEALLRGPPLIEAQKWFDQRSQDLSDQERKFIARSREKRERLARAEKERQQSELAEAEKRRREQVAAAKSVRRLAWVLAAVALGAVGTAIYVFWQKNEAEIRRQEAEIAKANANRQEAIARENANKEKTSRNAAEERAKIAESRRLVAQASEKKANDARDQADALINFMLYDLRDKLQPIGRLDALEDIPKKVKGYLERSPEELVNASRQEQKAAILSNLGDVLLEQGKLPEALDSYQQSSEIFKHLAEQDKSNAGWQRDLSLSYEKIGDVLRARGELRDALDLYQRSLEIFKRLAEQDKSNAGWQRDLSVSYNNVGDVLVAQGKLPEGLDAYQQSLRIRQILAEQDKSNAGWQRDLSLSYNKIGGVMVAQGTLPQALEAYPQSITIHQILAERGKTNAGGQREL